MKVQRGSVDLVASLLLIAITLGGAWAIAAYSCGARWKQSGLATDYGLGQGCLVQMPSGRWVPDKAVRDVDLGAAPSAPVQAAPAIPNK